MAKDNQDDKIMAVLLYVEGAKDAKEISSVMGVSIRTVRRWIRKYRADGIDGLARHKPGPPQGTGSISSRIRSRIIHLKQRHPPWRARRIKYQYDVSCH
ncbi:MAG: helix-turn-helix domain-containing protein [Thaumarchaeota archaeon]|nr:helix-turn-helix domain-containing protein [Nitrososphaerota archaeon]